MQHLATQQRPPLHTGQCILRLKAPGGGLTAHAGRQREVAAQPTHSSHAQRDLPGWRNPQWRNPRWCASQPHHARKHCACDIRGAMQHPDNQQDQLSQLLCAGHVCPTPTRHNHTDVAAAHAQHRQACRPWTCRQMQDRMEAWQKMRASPSWPTRCRTNKPLPNMQVA